MGTLSLSDGGLVECIITVSFSALHVSVKSIGTRSCCFYKNLAVPKKNLANFGPTSLNKEENEGESLKLFLRLRFMFVSNIKRQEHKYKLTNRMKDKHQ